MSVLIVTMDAPPDVCEHMRKRIQALFPVSPSLDADVVTVVVLSPGDKAELLSGVDEERAFRRQVFCAVVARGPEEYLEKGAIERANRLADAYLAAERERG